MNSSTSSSSGSERLVVLAVVAALVMVEVAMRAAGERLSVDIAHIRSAPEIAARLGESAGDPDVPRVLLLGNSLTRDGVEVGALRERFPGVRIEAFHPDGSSVNHWAYAFRRYFAAPGVAPDVLVVGVGRSHLFDSDYPAADFGAYYCGTGDLGRYFRRHIDDADDAAEFVLARASAAFTHRQRVQPRVFTRLVPHYQEVLPSLDNPAARGAGGVGPGAAPPPAPAHQNLSELLADARAAGVREVVVLAFPMLDDYPLPDATLDVLAAGGARLVDARDLAEIGPSHFPDDPFHLGPAGAAIVTRHLAAALDPILAREGQQH